MSGKVHLSAAKNAIWGFDWTNAKVRQSMCAPHWFGIVLSTALAAAPWVSWRLSLRTLLLGTTLVAVLLGLIVSFR